MAVMAGMGVAFGRYYAGTVYSYVCSFLVRRQSKKGDGRSRLQAGGG